MRSLLSKTAFVLAVLVLTLVFAVPLRLSLDWLWPVQRGPDGLYPSGHGFAPGVIAWTISLWTANRLVSIGFHTVGITPDRWSLWQRGGF